MPDQSPAYRKVPKRRLDPYPGDEPCECGAVTITDHYLSVTVPDDERDGHHYRRSSGDACEVTP